MRYHVILFCLLMVLISCTADSNPSSSENSPPNTPSINASSTSVMGGEGVSLVASASDPDDEVLTYQWSATGGSFSSTSNNSTDWTSPVVQNNSTYTISVSVQDPHGSSNNNSINISVLTEGTDPEPETIYITCNKDVFVSSSLPDNNFDISNQDFMGTFLALSPEGSIISFGETRIYVYFDLSSIPPNSTIDDAEIIMRPKSDSGVTNSNTTCGALMLCQFNFGSSSTDWVESSLTWNSSLNTAVTNSPRSGWLFDIANASSNLNASVKYDVQGYIDGNSNYVNDYNGWVIQSYSTLSTDFKLFWSSDCDGSSYFPKLKVTYH